MNLYCSCTILLAMYLCIVYVRGAAWVYLYILFMYSAPYAQYILFRYRELLGCTYIYCLCTRSCLGVPIYIVYVQRAAWVYLYILFMYRDLPRCIFIYCLCTRSFLGVPLYILFTYRELPGCTFIYFLCTGRYLGIYILFTYRELPGCTLIYCLCKGS